MSSAAGKEVERLERQFAEWLGVQGTVAAGYGRGALWLALELAIDGKPNVEVLVPEFVCAQVPEAVRRAGGRPVFFPVRRDLTVDEGALQAAITRNTRAAIVVHYFGCALPNVGRLAAMCRRHSVLLIEDCALALGARWSGRLAGRFGDLAAFSFTKSDWCYGGGVLATPVRDWAERARKLREEKCRPAARLAFGYGLLRRMDVAANSPGKGRWAGTAGRWLEKGFSLLEPSLAGNFFDAGRCDVTMPEFAARRARGMLSGLESAITRRRVLREELWQKLQAALLAGLTSAPAQAPAITRVRTREESGDTGAFLLLEAHDGHAARWVERADAAGWTLRLSWPAYQPIEPQCGSRHFASRLLICEIP